MSATPRLRRAGLAVAATLAAGTAPGCQDKDLVRPTSPVAQVRIVAAETAVVVGKSLTLDVQLLDSTARVLPGQPVAWSVSDSARAQVSSSGVLRAGPRSGDVRVRAKEPESGKADSVLIHVAAEGEVRWVYAPPSGAVFDAIGGPALGPDGTIYVLEDLNPGAKTSALVALSPLGETLWRTNLPGVRYNYPVVSPAGPVIVAGSTMYVVSESGAILWQAATSEPGPDFLSAAASDVLQVAALGTNAVAYALAQPTTLWTQSSSDLGAWLVPPTIDGRRGVAYLKHSEDTLFVVRLSDGAVLKTIQDPDSNLDNRVFGVGTVPLAGRFYLPTSSRLAAYDTSGALLWLTKDTGRGVTEPVVAPNGNLYVQERADGLWALRSNGAEWWRYPELVPRWTWYGGPAMAQGTVLYAAAQDRFMALDSIGNTLWIYRADSAGVAQAFIGAPAIAPDGTVYTFTSTHLYAFWGSRPPEPNSPWPMWRHDAQRTGWSP